MAALRDIRAFIPRTKLTDPNNFPEVDYQRYPLMPTDADGKPVDDGMGGSVVLMGPDEEQEFYASHPGFPRIPEPEDRANELQNLRDEVARLKAGKTEDAKPAVSSLVAKPNSDKPKLTLGKTLA